jgi:hypothetical protein
VPLVEVLAAWRRKTVSTVASVLALLILAGCASPGQRPSPYPADLPVRAELGETPFFPDESYYCGPAALATSLSAAGLPTQPEALVGQVFLPGRQGSLQIEMLSGARRHGAVATVIPASAEALFREIAAGHPVVVLQNLGLSWAPSWHYAVAIGYDIEAGIVLLRSGPMKRQELSLRTFMHTWNRSERWAFVTTRPDRLPVTATQAETVRALVAFERNAPASASAQAYRTGLERWPDNPTLAMGLGNVLYASGDKDAAEEVFRQVAQTHQLAAAYNNLARLLLERGNTLEARRSVERGLVVAGRLRGTLMETLQAIESASSAPR